MQEIMVCARPFKANVIRRPLAHRSLYTGTAARPVGDKAYVAVDLLHTAANTEKRSHVNTLNGAPTRKKCISIGGAGGGQGSTEEPGADPGGIHPQHRLQSANAHRV